MKEAYEHYLAVKAKYPGKTEAGGKAVDEALELLLVAVAAELDKPDVIAVAPVDASTLTIPERF